MKHIFPLIILLASIYFKSSAQPQLIIRNGEVKILPAQTHLFSKILIENGGTLKILDNSSQWCILHCNGDVTINGKIEYTKFHSINATYNVTSPDGTNLSHTFNATNVGGTGGNGGSSRCKFNILTGGKGEVGTLMYGGGGGAGGIFIGSYSNCQNKEGNNAVKSKGGTKSNREGKGGDGQKRADYGNGGLLFIYCDKDFDGNNGNINLSGLNGSDGENGEKNSLQNRGDNYDGCGGGGGGAPGCLGGVCIVRVKGTIINYPSVIVNGGKGGKKGNGAVGGYMGIATAQDGNDGEDAPNGFVRYINN